MALQMEKPIPKRKCRSNYQKNDKRHRADIVNNQGVVIELQHSSISTVVMRERELFYENMLWVFDLAGKRKSFEKRGQIDEQTNEKEFSFKWTHPKRSLFVCKMPLYFDYGTKKMLCVTKISYRGFGTGYFVEKDEFILEHGGIPKTIT